MIILFQVKKEVIVDLACGMAVLRGADVFVLGIMAAPACIIIRFYHISLVNLEINEIRN
jgi:hypothetical protein